MTTETKLVELSKEEGEVITKEIQSVLDKHGVTFQIVPKNELQILKVVKTDAEPTTEPESVEKAD